jgi:UrcA family protein
MGSSHQTNNKAFPLHAIAMLLAGVLVVSNAQADEQVRRETVKFEDLNVGTNAGVEALYTRIHTAAKRVCLETDAALKYAEITCARRAVTRAVQDVNLPLLTAYYRMKTGDHTEPLIAKR